MKKIQSEKIIKVWRFCYAKIYTDTFNWDLKTKNRQWLTNKIFWRFYWLTPTV